MSILVDLDEVFADFRRAAWQAHGRGPEEQTMWEEEEGADWDIAATLNISNSAFWKPITQSGSEFWENLHPLKWAEDLTHHLNATVGKDWYVVTAPSLSAECLKGKVIWMQNFFGKSFQRYVLTQHKHLLASPEHLLIDDNESNILKFQRAGGAAHVFPAKFNSLKDYHNSPVQYLISTEVILTHINSKGA